MQPDDRVGKLFNSLKRFEMTLEQAREQEAHYQGHPDGQLPATIEELEADKTEYPPNLVAGHGRVAVWQPYPLKVSCFWPRGLENQELALVPKKKSRRKKAA